MMWVEHDVGLLLPRSELLEVINALKLFYDNTTDEQIDEINATRRHEYHKSLILLYLEKREFRRSKNRSKSWVFHCRNCQKKMDDAVEHYYWTLYDKNFCTKFCALQYNGVAKDIEKEKG